MKRIVGAISGGSMLISGTLVLNLVMAGMDWGRIADYGLFHELGIRGATFMFLIGVAFMIVGCICMGVAAFAEPEEKILEDE